MQWNNKCLNVWLGGTKRNSHFYNCRVTDTGGGVVLIIQKDGDMVLRETYQSTVDEVKALAETWILSRLN